MAAVTAGPATSVPPAPPAPPPGRRRAPNRLVLAGVVLVVWYVAWRLLRGTATLELEQQSLEPLHRWLNDVRDAVDAGRNSNPLFLYVFNEIRLVIDALANLLSALLAQPAYGRPVPLLGWLGVVAVAAYLAGVLGNWRVGLLTGAGFVFFGLQGLWTESMDTLALTLAAVLVSLLVGIPLGVWAGLSDRFQRVVTPVLDFMQILPTFVYLLPLVLFFAIGPASAVIATLIYAAPPAIRITAHGIRSVAPNSVEASVSLGSTRRQTLTGVLLPMARRTIVLGINQTIMAALSMVTIAALIDAPGLGQTVLKALQTLDIGTAFNAGLGIVVMAIVLDRVTTAISERSETARRASPRAQRLRRPVVLAGGAVTLVCVYLGYTYSQYAVFPEEAGGRSVVVGDDIARGVDAATAWVTGTFNDQTEWVKNGVTRWAIGPVETMLADTPWFVVLAALVALAALAGGLRVGVTALLCLAVVLGTGLWNDAMVTLGMTLVATVLTLAVAVVVGVWMGRSRAVDRVVRPFLDAAQTLPSFVYLIPFVALFDSSRFTAIVAALVYAAPIAIKLVADGIRGVAPATVEAAVSAGTGRWQMVTKVQLPMARASLVLAANQGLIYVLSMVVIGGLVGAGALGYDVVGGFRQSNLYGKGLAAGVAIVMLGIMLDRTTQAAARRAGGAGR